MLLSSLLSLLPAFSFSHTIPQEASKGEFNYDIPHAHAWPSIHESAIAARRILKLHGISTLSSIFPATGHSSHGQQQNGGATGGYADADAVSAFESRPPAVAGAPIGLMDYHASCAPHAYDPVLIGVTIATTMRNAAAGSNVTLSLRYHMPSPASPPSPPSDDPWAYLPANLPRFALVGYLERVAEEDVEGQKLDDCFFAAHPDAKIWAPGGELEPHDAWWARLRVQEVFFFGGFGDRARIGWLPLREWQHVTDDEIDAYRLPGEDGWLKQRNQARLEVKLDSDDGEWEDPLVVELK